MDFFSQHDNYASGLANYVLVLFANAIFVAFNSTADSFPRKKCVVCENPVRLSLRNKVSKAAAKSHFFPGYRKTSECKAKVLVVLGGSYGANVVNIAMLNLYYQMLRQNSCLYIIWQIGVESYDKMDNLVKNHPRLYMAPDLVQKIFSKIRRLVLDGLESMRSDKLKLIIKDMLQRRRYLVIFDDVWHMHEWEAIKYW
ncbi:hypothetical protein HN51_035384 [Arachis hypogaea]